LKYHSEYGFILLMGICKTSDFARAYELKESKEQCTGAGIGYEFVCSFTYMNKRFKRTGATKKEARWAAAEALLAECRISEAQIKEKALDVFELATKKHPELSRDHIYEDLDDKAMARCSYKSPMIGFENIVSASFKNKKDAKKDLVFKLLKSIWADMERKLKELRARGVQYDEVKVVTRPEQTFIPRNQKFEPQQDQSPHSTNLGLSSSCTLSNVIIQDLHAMPKPKATTNGHHNGLLLQGSWTGPLPTAKPTQMPPPLPPQQPKINHDMRNLNIGFGHSNRLDRPNFDSNRSMENKKPGDTNVCIICTQRKRGKRMKELYKDCIHDSFICEDCKFLHEQMKRAKKSTNPKVCPLCYLLSYNRADHQLGHMYGARDYSNSVYSVEKTIPLSFGISNPGCADVFNGKETLGEYNERRKT